ncbi:hypothetical protein JTB14_006335 [Gonioctena quinquepunctata]|nr:hypothetical protein JTB14_006335 [Gonioctena quinquepunctata]
MRILISKRLNKSHQLHKKRSNLSPKENAKKIVKSRKEQTLWGVIENPIQLPPPRCRSKRNESRPRLSSSRGILLLDICTTVVVEERGNPSRDTADGWPLVFRPG